ncbi:MAG: DUF1993 domain-containing protein [Pseudomonadota bacterium]
MPLTLYAVFIPTARQTLGALRGMIDKGEAHVKEHGLSDEDLIEASLAEDMWALPHHVRSCWLHGSRTLELIPDGEFSPDFTEIPKNWDAMRAMVDDALGKLDACKPDTINALEGTHVRFVLGGKCYFEGDGQDFLLSFNQPNLYFHAATFYDILRHKGVVLGKPDFLGPMRLTRN